MTNQNTVLAFAEQELRRLFGRMDPAACPSPRLLVDPAAFPTLDDPALDDAYTVEWSGVSGSVVGSNPRSVLLGVYALLQEAGCRFIRPGALGEVVPARSLADFSAAFTRVADHRYRGVCVEGADSEENVRDMIDWLPKLGFNLYYVQFREAHIFFQEWYEHWFNEFLPKDENYTVADSRAIVERLSLEMSKRGLSHHACGHGWLCESIGYSSTGWHTAKDEEIPDEVRPLLAQVNGVRTFFGDIPVNTQLCYSSPEVQRRVVREIVTYALAHPEKDVLHIWLADNFNNTCECEACQHLRPADYYVQMLNEVDRQLTAAGSPMKLSFLLGYDTLWVPLQERIQNPDRFILLFAPITRNFRVPYMEEGTPLPTAQQRRAVTEQDVAPYQRNRLLLPETTEENLNYLYLWQQQFPGDCFVYDYHMMWDIHKNYAQMDLSKVQFRDVETLHAMGLQGYISCQLNRSNFPSGLCNYLLGRKLFDVSLTYEQGAAEYFEAAYGSQWETARTFLYLINDGFSWAYSRGELPVVNPQVAALLKETPQRLYDYRPLLRQGESAATVPEQKRMWQHLQEAAEIYAELALVLYNKASGADTATVHAQYELFRQNLCRRELFLQEVFDLCSFCLIVSTIVDKEEDEAIAFDKKAT